MKETLNQLQLSAQSQPKPVAQSQSMMELQFALSTKDVDLMERCKALFTEAQDRVSLQVRDNVAHLQIQRRFPQSALSQTLALHQDLQARGCLETQDSFRYQVVPN